MDYIKTEERIYKEYVTIAFGKDEKTADKIRALGVLRQMTEDSAKGNALLKLKRAVETIERTVYRN